MTTKICVRCKVEKDISEFHNRKRSKDGKAFACAECINYGTRNSPNRKKHQKAWNEKRKGYHKEYYEKNKIMWLNRGRENYLIRTFGITQKQFDEMLESQGGVCAICGKQERVYTPGLVINETRRMCIDHDHKTGKIRGILCYACNVSIGRFDDNPETLRRAAEYLEKFRESDSDTNLVQLVKKPGFPAFGELVKSSYSK